MSLESCIRQAKEWAKENSEVRLNSTDLENIGRLLSYAEEHGADPAEKTALMSELVDQKLARDQAVARAVRIKNILTNEKNLSEVLTNGEAWSNDGARTGKAYVEAMNAKILGNATRAGVGSNLDPFLTKSSTLTHFLEFARNALSKENLKIFQSMENNSDMARDVMLELGALRNKPDMLGQTNNEIALAIAKGIRETQDFSLQKLKGVNPHFSENDDFLLSRTYDRDLMAKVTRTEFVKRMMQRGDILAGASPQEKYRAFANIYDEKMSGTYIPSETNTNNEWGSTKDLGKAAAPRRVVTMNSPLDEWKHSVDFGRPLYQTFLEGLEDRAQTIATVQKWGLNSGDNVATLYSKTLSSLMKRDPDAAAEFARAKDDFKDKYASTQVRRANLAYTWEGKAAQNLMAASNVVYLGSHVPRSFNSWSTAIDLTKDSMGKSLPEHAFDLAAKMSQAMMPGGNAGREAAMALGVPIRSYEADLMGQIGAAARQKPGMLAKGAQLIGQAGLTDRFVASGKSTVAQVEAAYLASHADKPFEALSPAGQAELTRYNLHGPAWEVARQAVVKAGPMKGMITPEAIQSLTDEQTSPLLRAGASPRDAMAARTELATNYSTYLSDKASMSMKESNSATRYTAYGTSTIDQPWGIARRLAMQFKNAALVEQQAIQRVYQNGGGNTAGIPAVLSYAVKGAFLGMLGQYVIDAAKGKTPASPFSGEMVGRGLMNGMGAGILGDVLFHSMQEPTPARKVAMMTSDLVGAGPNLAFRVGAAGAKTLQGIGQYAQGNEKPGQFGMKDWADLIGNAAPGHNIFYASGAINYTLVNAIHEVMGDEGYLGRLRQTNAKTDAWPESLGGPGGGVKNFWE